MTRKNGNTIRWGILGCGNVTEVKSGPAYQQVEGFQITAVMRRDLEKAKDYAMRVNPKLKFFEVSATSGQGMDQWIEWLQEQTQ